MEGSGETSQLLVTASVRLAQFPAGGEWASCWGWDKATVTPVGQQGGWQDLRSPQAWGMGEVWI